MNIKRHTIKGSDEESKCYVHLRGAAMGDGKLLLTFQKLETVGMDTFYPLEVIFSYDGGETFTKPREEKVFIPFIEDNVRYVPCDAYPCFHKKTGKVIIVGTFGAYSPEGFTQADNPRMMSFYSVYSPVEDRFYPINIVGDIAGIECSGVSFGCVQFYEEANGDILIPAAIKKEGNICSVVVLRYSFDGEKLTLISRSNIITNHTGRGVYEPSLIKYKGKYLLTLRHDDCAMYSESIDGESFSEPKIWTWDNGESLPSYNTQSHFILLNNKPFLVYTRKGLDNDHVFRHRAPLLMAEINADKICVKRSTEVIVVPERGARLGNFGVIQEDENTGYVTVSEWMQPKECKKYGSDNTSYVVKVTDC